MTTTTSTGTTAFSDTVARFTADPSAGRITPTVKATLANGRARLSAGPFNWDSDLSPLVGGHNEAPSPVAYLLGALAGCGVAFLADTLAPQFGVEIEEATATARCGNDLAGLLGVAGADPTLKGIAITISVSSPSPQDRVAAMQEAWLQRCPVYLALRDANPVDVTFT
jgi:uncharacterized OsmC-like protein